MKKLEIGICVVTVLVFGFLNWVNLDSTQLKQAGYTNEEIRLILKNNENNKEYLKKHYIKDIKDLLTNKDFKAEYLKRYHQFYKENEIDFDKVVYLVNHHFDEIDSFVYSEVIFSLLENPYFLYQNTTRYMAYYETHQNLEEVVQAVNCNLDYDYYSHVTSADVAKNHFILVNKYHQLENTYVPKNLVSIDSFYGVGMLEKEAYDAFKKLSDDAEKEGYHIGITSGYRSYERQDTIYHNYVEKDGQEKADTYSARPGFSEHQTGLAIDISTYKDKKTDYTWIHENSFKYGFILRYPEGKEHITGYMYEPWHFRYVGVEVAKKIRDLSLTYDEYYAYFLNNI